MRASLADDMSPRQLVVPAEACMNFTISKAIAIADQKVVAQSLIAKLDMLAVDGFRSAKGLSQVMNDDGSPLILIQGNCQIKD